MYKLWMYEDFKDGYDDSKWKAIGIYDSESVTNFVAEAIDFMYYERSIGDACPLFYLETIEQ